MIGKRENVQRRIAYHRFLLAWLILFFLLGMEVWSLLAGHLMVVSFLLLGVVLYGLMAWLIRCPRCNAPVLRRPARIGRMEIFLWSIVMPGRCRECGTPL